MLQLFIIFYGLPSFGIYFNGFTAAVIAFSLNLAAYNSEIIRSAIQAVPIGQSEAGYMVGLNYFQVMTRIVLPQAFRTAVPPLFNSLISMIKNTSLAANITVVEMFMATQRIVGIFNHGHRDDVGCQEDRGSLLRTVLDVYGDRFHLSDDLYAADEASG